DVFFHQHHGAWILLGCIPYLAVCTFLAKQFLALPNISYPHFSTPGAYVFNTLVIAVVGAGFYFFRYGGSLLHTNKPRWDRIPDIVKEDIFFARASVDDLIALKEVWLRPLHDSLAQTNAEMEASIEKIIPPSRRETWGNLQNPVYAFERTAKGAKIKKPRHIFLVVGESYSQLPFDRPYEALHIVDGGRKFREDPHAVSLNHFLSAGDLSRPSIVGLMTGIFDARLELNEREGFWRGTVPTALPVQLKKLGYESVYWYGGSVIHGNFNQFAPANGFDRVMSATEFCAPDAPKTWVGVYDHVFLETAAQLIREMDTGRPVFHFIYTTSNHGPHKMNLKKLGYDAEQIMPEAPSEIKNSRQTQQILGSHWYSDRALSHFIEAMKRTYPDSLIIVTGDHSYIPGPLNQSSLLQRADYSFREQFCTSFMLYHQDIKQDILAGNTIGGHMHIMPTIIELIAPQGFTYYSLFPSLTESIDQVVTPYHWLTRDAIGPQGNSFYQPLTVSAEEIPTLQRDNPFARQADDWCVLTSWLLRHTDKLEPAEQLIK
ncbi:MAG: sulfatase-like hydrolase/transferase, partial [Veillonellales bacterium]